MMSTRLRTICCHHYQKVGRNWCIMYMNRSLMKNNVFLTRRVDCKHHGCARWCTTLSQFDNQKQRQDQRNKKFNEITLCLLALFPMSLLSLINNSSTMEAAINSDDVNKVRQDLSRKLDVLRKEVSDKYGLPENTPFRRIAVSFDKACNTVSFSFRLPNHAAPLETIAKLLNRLPENCSLRVEDISSADDLSELVLNDKNAGIRMSLNREEPNGTLKVELNQDLSKQSGSVADSVLEAYRVSVEYSAKNRKKSVESVYSVFDSNFNNNIERSFSGKQSSSSSDPTDRLKQLGVRVFLPDDDEKGKVYDPSNANDIWKSFAGHEDVKQEVEDTILLALNHPEVYLDIIKRTRKNLNASESALPRAILFEGPPGCGKTSCAKIISRVSGVPLIYIPIEIVMSKFYGESENILSEIFRLVKGFGKAIVFIDEIDSLATSRDSSFNIHEATRRVLSVLLRALDGIESSDSKRRESHNMLVIAATNRKKDLDAALLSRFNLSVTFNLPNVTTRQEIFQLYAQQLKSTETKILAEKSEGFSGRDIKDVCELAERRFASRLVRHNEKSTPHLPNIADYLDAIDSKHI